MIKPPHPTRTELGANQLSYAAGSTSLEPYGFRVLGQSDSQRLSQLLESFPQLASWLRPDSLIISAYPAALGLNGFAPLVDTYLHPPTFIRAMRLAALENRTVVMAAQPLAGADLLLRTLRQQKEIPKRLLWAAGGYYFPLSLECFIRDSLAQVGCEIEYLHCYGVAEIGHTCFAAMDRFESAHPRYRKVAAEVTASVLGTSCQLALRHDNGREIVTEDFADEINGDWLIQSGHGRMSPQVRDQLESWSSQDWSRRTGYLAEAESVIVCQLREWIDNNDSISSEMTSSKMTNRDTAKEQRYFRFWEQHGGSMQCKPKWNQALRRTTMPPSESSHIWYRRLRV